MYEEYEQYEDTHIAVVCGGYTSAASLYVFSDTRTTAMCVLILLKLMLLCPDTQTLARDAADTRTTKMSTHIHIQQHADTFIFTMYQYEDTYTTSGVGHIYIYHVPI